MRRMRCALACLLLAASMAASAQTFDLDALRQPVAALSGQWRFHPGDDPSWARPDLNDASWPLLHTDRHWQSQGYPNVTVGWYRLHLLLPERAGRLAIFIPGFRANYELFADGVRIGGAGSVSASVISSTMTSRFLLLPAPRPGSRDMVLAFRVAQSRVAVADASVVDVPSIVVGDPDLVAFRATRARTEISWSEVNRIVLTLAWIAAGCAGAVLFLLRPQEKEYGWFGAMSFAIAAFFGWGVYAFNHTVSFNTFNFGNTVTGGTYTLCSIFFFQRLLKLRSRWFFRIALIAASSILLLGIVTLIHPLSGPAMNAGGALGLTPVIAWLLVSLFLAARQGVADARLTLIPVLTMWSLFLFNLVLEITNQVGMFRKTSPLNDAFTTWPFELSINDLSQFFFLLGFVAILLNRFTRSRKQEERYASEMEAARVVQQVLLPEPNAELPGFTISAEYHPAQEVGGDFYQVLRAQDDGLLIIAGDVSGKGLPAAMLVAMLVGAFRAEAAHTSDPAFLLQALNERVHGRMNGGFATCLVLHVRSSGSVSVANAANPAPYLNGRELELAAALPVGIAGELTYECRQFLLQPGDTLTLVSDGIVEAARPDTRELYGFERTQAASLRSAAEQLEMARSFGQNDDMTVLTVTRV